MAASQLIESARRRLQIQILFSQALVALSIGAAGLVILLIFGTQVFDWYWPVLLAGASFGYLVYRLAGHLPDSYKAAQILDHRLATSDIFSSAHYFRSQPATPLTTALIEAADQAAKNYHAADAVPFTLPRGWGRAAALATVALSLLVVRYAFQSSLDLGAPIAPGMYQLLASGEKPTPRTAQNNRKDPLGQPLEGVNLTDAQKSGQEKRMDKGQDVAADAASATENAAAGQKPGQFNETMSPSEEGEQLEGAEKGDKAAGSDRNQQGNEPGEKQGGADKKSGAQQNQGNQQGDKSSLMDKFKDAMANMMNKLKSQDKSDGQQQQAQNKQDGNQGGNNQQQQQQASNKGQQQQQQGKQQAGGQQNNQDSQQQGQSSQQQAKGGDKSSQSPSGDQKSGSGKQDGAKDVQLAEQQRAMGKISEVFGKRAQNLQGEIMIEVSSSKSQSLKTGYSGKSASHSDTSGVIQRDEVPLIHQNYVQRYFEELRKSPPPVSSSAAGTAAPKATP
jgi:hypothetical protein